jgi:Tol biopolymer transport system component
MRLARGTRLGCYEVAELLGVGGMGEVYRARDTKLGRDVALKIMSAAFAEDPERMGRFTREAKVLASLNHSSIAAIYGLEDSGATHALVMELVEGPTLAERIGAGGPIPLDEALPIAKQICEALEFAHEHGIVHRDLKPANVKVTVGGVAKVLDFGLARALTGDTIAIDDSNSPTMSYTQAGTIVGTAAYMSPEQARGKPADRRADIWAFGCLLYEMLTAKRAFDGETYSDTLVSILMEAPDWSPLFAGTPEAICVLLQHCLQKDPRHRLQAIGDARIAIEEVLAGATGARSAVRSAVARVRAQVWQRWLPWAVAGALGAGLLAVLFAPGSVWRRDPQRAIELSLNIPSDEQLEIAAGPGVVLSPDGSRAAYSTRGSSPTGANLYLREFDKEVATPFVGTGNATAPFFSPDNQWIGFFADGKLKKVAVRGGAPITLCDSTSNRGAAWGENGNVYFTPAPTSSLSRVAAAGGTPVAATHLDVARREVTHRWPQLLPGEKAILFTGSPDNDNFEHAAVEVAPLDTGKPERLVENATFGRYVSPGYLVYLSQGTLFAAPFNAAKRKLTGSAVPVLSGLYFDIRNGSAQVAVSANGTLAALTGRARKEFFHIVLRDRDGKATVLLADQPDIATPRLSPDGKRLAFQKEKSVWIYDLVRGSEALLTLGQSSGTFPVWSPDGTHVAYTHPSASGSTGHRIYWKRADGTGEEEPLTPPRALSLYPNSWSPDGKFLVFYGFLASGICCEIMTVDTKEGAPPAEPKPLLGRDMGSNLGDADVSPDGRWVAYQSNESGSFQVYVAPFPGPGVRSKISTGSGIEPRWSKSGRELFYLSAPDLLALNRAELVAVPYSVQRNSFVHGKPVVLYKGGFQVRATNMSYDVTPDGQHFVMFQPTDANIAGTRQPTVVLNWSSELGRLVAAGQAGARK